MRYHPPKMRGISQEDYDLYNQVIEASYRYHDMMLGRMIDLTEEKYNVCTYFLTMASSLGKNRLLALPKEAGAPAYDHRPLRHFCSFWPKYQTR